MSRRPRAGMIFALLSSLALHASNSTRADDRGALDVGPEDLRPGLVATYRSLVDPAATLHRIDAKPAFTLGHSSPHPRIPSGPFEVTWTGILLIQETTPITFHANLGGELSIVVDGTTVLRGRGESDTSRVGPGEPLSREPGAYRVTITYRTLRDTPARLQLLWASTSFALEPVPAWRLFHLPASVTPEGMRDIVRERGRLAAGTLGCARCHQSAFPGAIDPPPGPSLADARSRLNRDWLLEWLKSPHTVRPGARMPALFTANRQGDVERWIIAEFLAGSPKPAADPPKPAGDHRLGRRVFLGMGCAACHFLPDLERAEQADLDRVPLVGLADRLSADDLAAFLANPHARYPDGRMPRLPVNPEAARDIAAYLLLWSKPSPARSGAEPPKPDELREVARRFPPAYIVPLPVALMREKGCTSCHTGLGDSLPRDVPIKEPAARGCLAANGIPHFTLDPSTHEAITAYLPDAARDQHHSPVAARQRQLQRAGCVRCHQRDSDRPPPIEVAGSTLGTAWLMSLPFQRTPRITNPHQKFLRGALLAAVREGVTGLRHDDYTYRMPSFGTEAETLVQALAEADGELVAAADPAAPAIADPTLATLAGPSLVGSQGYSCISCHVWNGRLLSQPDPGALGPDLTRVTGRIRRDWFDRFIEGPSRVCPGTPMPAIYERGKPALLTSVLDGDPAKQKDALWSYFSRGKDAPEPKPAEPLPATAPAPGAPPLIAQVPLRMPDGKNVESLSILNSTHDLLVYDLNAGAPQALFTGARILRSVQGRLRPILASGTAVGANLAVEPAIELRLHDKSETAEQILLGYDTLSDGARIRRILRFPSGSVDLTETDRIIRDKDGGRLLRELRFAKVPRDAKLGLRVRSASPLVPRVAASVGEASIQTAADILTATLTPNREQSIIATAQYPLPAAESPPVWQGRLVLDPGPADGSLERPGYRAVPFPRPKLISGEDRIMPVALAVRPRDGRLFVASWKTGEILTVDDPSGDVKNTRFVDFGRGLFQDAFSMLAGDDGLYVLHRRNLTRLVDTDGDGVADRFDRVAALPHGIADTYDYGYGLTRDKAGNFVISFAPHANHQLSGSGGALRLIPGEVPREVAYGFRNPLGWSSGPEGEIFFTDNQGEWVATNKLCHLVEGRFYGYPNQAQKSHASLPPGKAAVWVPYAWAHSINGVTYDNSGGKFGPFAGQFFLAELMFGGAIIRADVEKVNGQYQGACFPFWGKGLLGPESLAFDPKGHLYVGGITEPGWMAQPDRGAVFRIDYTGQPLFEMRTIRALPRGFRVIFTTAIERSAAVRPESYRLERYRYELTGSYGSPELDRTPVPIERVVVADDGLSADLFTAPLVTDRIYLLTASGVRSADGKPLLNPAGAYTLNEVPSDR